MQNRQMRKLKNRKIRRTGKSEKTKNEKHRKSRIQVRIDQKNDSLNIGAFLAILEKIDIIDTQKEKK